MNYDTLRAKIREAKDLLDQLKAKMEEEYKEWQAAKDKKADGLAELEKARAEYEAAKKAYEEAVRRVNELEGRAQKPGTGVGGAIGEAIKDVQKEMDDLEKCKEALAKAKKKLKDLLEQQAKEKELADKEVFQLLLCLGKGLFALFKVIHLLLHILDGFANRATHTCARFLRSALQLIHAPYGFLICLLGGFIFSTCFLQLVQEIALLVLCVLPFLVLLLHLCLQLDSCFSAENQPRVGAGIIKEILRQGLPQRRSRCGRRALCV
jgi:hypothetical protein